MPQMGPNQWILMSNMAMILLILPTVSNFLQSYKPCKPYKKEQTTLNWKW